MYQTQWLGTSIEASAKLMMFKASFELLAIVEISLV